MANQMAQIPGFIGWVSPVVGRRLFTATAWEDPKSAAQLLRSGPYKEAVDPSLAYRLWCRRLHERLGPTLLERHVGAMHSLWAP